MNLCLAGTIPIPFTFENDCTPGWFLCCKYDVEMRSFYLLISMESIIFPNCSPLNLNCNYINILKI